MKRIRACLGILFVAAILVGGRMWYSAHYSTDQWMLTEPIIQRYKANPGRGDDFRVTVLDGYMYPDHVCDLYIDEMVNGNPQSVWWLRRTRASDEPANHVFSPISLRLVYDTPVLRCYEVWSGSYVLYRAKPSGKWLMSAYAEFRDASLQTSTYSVHPDARERAWRYWAILGCPKPSPYSIRTYARYRFFSGEWRWIRIFGAFLVRQGESDVTATLQRYARGKFTKRELEANRHSGDSPAQMQKWAQETLDNPRRGFP